MKNLFDWPVGTAVVARLYGPGAFPVLKGFYEYRTRTVCEPFMSEGKPVVRVEGASDLVPLSRVKLDPLARQP